MIIPLRSTGKSCPIGLTTAERKREESNLKRAGTKLLKDYGGYSLPIPGGMGAIGGSPERICFCAARAVAVEFKVAETA